MPKRHEQKVPKIIKLRSYLKNITIRYYKVDHRCVSAHLTTNRISMIFSNNHLLSLSMFMFSIALTNVSLAQNNVGGATVKGYISYAGDSVVLEVTLTGVKTSAMGAARTSEELKKHLEIVLKDEKGDPIRRSSGSFDQDDFRIQDVYWDSAAATAVSVADSGPNEVKITYQNIRILKNPNYTTGDTLREFFNDDNTVYVEIGFAPYNTGNYAESKDDLETEFSGEITKLFALASAAPTFDSLRSTNGGVSASWTVPSEVPYSDEESRNPPTSYAVLFTSTSLDLTTESTVANTETGVDTPGGECQVADATDGSVSCVSCNGSETQQIFLDLEELKRNDSVVAVLTSEANETGEISKAALDGLTIGQVVYAFVGYDRGTQWSSCESVTVTRNFSFTEANGEEDAKLTSDDCFIATATYGTSMAKEIGIFRWFRNEYLLSNSAGKWAVKKYYQFGPALASEVSSSPLWKSVSLGILSVLSMFLHILKSLGMPLLNVILGCGLFTYAIFSRRKMEM